LNPARVSCTTTPLTARRFTGAPYLATYAIVLGALAWPWLRDAATAVPEVSPFVCLPSDARLITFVLDWVARTLPLDPTHLFDLPIFHPAERQLAGTEHFLSAQLLYAPLRWVTGEPVLAVSLQYSPPLAIERQALPRDVPVGESVRVSLDLTPPRDVAASTATVFVRQGDGSAAMTAVSPRLLRVPFSDAMGRFMPGPAS
jgi:hypothetical protein